MTTGFDGVYDEVGEREDWDDAVPEGTTFEEADPVMDWEDDSPVDAAESLEVVVTGV